MAPFLTSRAGGYLMLASPKTREDGS